LLATLSGTEIFAAPFDEHGSSRNRRFPGSTFARRFVRPSL
jgi:hypothetical protein